MYYSGSTRSFERVIEQLPTNGLWLTPCFKTAQNYGSVARYKVNVENSLDLRDLGWETTMEQIKEVLEFKGVNLHQKYYTAFKNNAIEEEQSTWFCYSIIDGINWREDRAIAIKAIREAGYDSILFFDTHYGTQADSLVIFTEDQIVSYEDHSSSS